MRFSLTNPALKTAVLIFVVFRLFLSVWAILVLTVSPVPTEPDDVLRPYAGQPILSQGVAGHLLGPWQRFDTMHYTRIAAVGYENEKDSVFPPLYPFFIRLIGLTLGNDHQAHMIGAIIVSNAAAIGLFALIFHITAVLFSTNTAARAVIYLSLFPTGFFLLAPYSESLFILLATGAIWLAIRGKFPLAGFLGLLASLTRLTGIVLCVPLFLAWWQNQGRILWTTPEKSQRLNKWLVPKLGWLKAWPGVMPLIGTSTFLIMRSWLGLPPLSQIYQTYWFQTSQFPGYDLWRAAQTLFFQGSSRSGEFTLWFDFLVIIFLIITTYFVFRRLGWVWGSYNLMLLIFMLLPTSDLKPLYSFSRYALAFVPTFILLADSGERPLINRLILYSSLPLFLYFSGQFFIWGWVA